MDLGQSNNLNELLKQLQVEQRKLEDEKRQFRLEQQQDRELLQKARKELEMMRENIHKEKKEAEKEKYINREKRRSTGSNLMAYKSNLEMSAVAPVNQKEEKHTKTDSVKKVRRKSVPSRPKRDSELSTNEHQNGLTKKSTSTKSMKDNIINSPIVVTKERKDPLQNSVTITTLTTSVGKTTKNDTRKDKKVVSPIQTKLPKKHKKSSDAHKLSTSSPRGEIKEPTNSPRGENAFAKVPASPKNESKTVSTPRGGGEVKIADKKSEASRNNKKSKKSSDIHPKNTTKSDVKPSLLSPPEKLQNKTKKALTPKSEPNMRDENEIPRKKHKKTLSNVESPFVTIKSITSPRRKHTTGDAKKETDERENKNEVEVKNDKQKKKEVKRKRQIKKIHRKNSDAMPERKKREKQPKVVQPKKKAHPPSEPPPVAPQQPAVVQTRYEVEVETTESTTLSNQNTSEKESETSNSDMTKKKHEGDPANKRRVTKRKRSSPSTKVAPPSTSESEPQSMILPAETQDFTQEELDRLPEDFFTNGEVVNTMLQLHLSQNRLNRIPEDIGLCSKLNILDISYNNILVLPAAIGNLHSLKKLLISGNPYIKLPPEISRLSKLKSIRLNQNKFIEIPEEIFLLPSIKKINLSNNSIFKIPPKISVLTSLETLNMSYNKLTEVPHQIGSCTSLTYISLRNNNLKWLPPELAKLTSLETLILLYNNLTELPQNCTLSLFPELALIDIQYNQIEALHPDFFSGTSKFQELYAGHNKLKTLPPSIANCQSITILDFKKNYLTIPLPPFNKLVNLNQLVLGQNRLSTFPEGIGKCTSLRTLNLFGNEITVIPDEVNNLTLLKYIYLGYNQIKEFRYLGVVTNGNLKELYLAGNPFNTIPKQIGLRAWNLSFLYLNNMNLTFIPKELGNLRSLKQLDLGHNNITTLPIDLRNLISLFSLDLSHNELANTDRPDADGFRWDEFNWWEQLEWIGVIDLSFNKLVVPPIGLLELSDEKLVEIVLDHNPFAKSVKAEVPFEPRPTGQFSVGWSELVGQRETQEDCFLINGSIGNPSLDMGIFGLFDGHVSRAAAQFASINFVDHLLQHTPFDDLEHAPLHALRETFYSINNSWREVISSPECSADSSIRYCGSTGVVALFVGEHLYVANVGDSRAVLYKGGARWNSGDPSHVMKPYVERLTHDHKPEHEDEEQRIREAGGYVVDGRLGGILGVSRGIGDFYMYPMVSAQAYVNKCILPRHPDAFLLVCCDGVWDELTDEDAVCLVHESRKNNNLYEVSTKLRDYSFLMGSDDNISSMIIKWDKKL